MRMYDMITYLENRGFEADKAYDRDRKIYTFTIRKGSNKLSMEFEYPDSESGDEVDRIQRNFLDDLMHRFDGIFGVTTPKAEVTTSKTTKILHDAQCKNMTGLLQINGMRVPVRVTKTEEPHGKFPRVECAVLSTYVETPATDELIEYCARDVAVTKQLMKNMLNSVYGAHGAYGLAIKDVIFSPPATIVFWMDGTKTVVKCQEEDKYDPEKGLAMAISKKAMGNNYSYYNTFKHWLKKWPRDYVKQVMKTGVDPDIAISGSYFSNWASRMSEIFNIKKEN